LSRAIDEIDELSMMIINSKALGSLRNKYVDGTWNLFERSSEFLNYEPTTFILSVNFRNIELL